MFGNTSLDSRQWEVTLPPEFYVKFRDYDRLIIYLFLLVFYGKLETECYLLKGLFNQISFNEEFRCYNLELARLSYVDIFHDSRPQWLMLRYGD